MTEKHMTIADCQTVEDYRNFSIEADYRARSFVNRMRIHGRSGKLEPVGWEFAERFRDHPYVQQAEAEGWGKELRAALIFAVRKRILLGMPFDVISELMPKPDWIAEQRKQAERYRLAKEWQEQNCWRWQGPNKDKWKEDDAA